MLPPLGPAVVVETAEGSSYARRFVTAAQAPGIFTASGEGRGQGAVLLAGAGALAAPRGYAEEAVLFAGLAPALAAVNLVVVEVPQGIEPSAAAEALISIGGRKSQPGVTIAVE